MEGVKLKITDH